MSCVSLVQRSVLRVADTAFTGEKEVPLDAACLAE